MAPLARARPMDTAARDALIATGYGPGPLATSEGSAYGGSAAIPVGSHVIAVTPPVVTAVELAPPVVTAVEQAAPRETVMVSPGTALPREPVMVSSAAGTVKPMVTAVERAPPIVTAIVKPGQTAQGTLTPPSPCAATAMTGPIGGIGETSTVATLGSEVSGTSTPRTRPEVSRSQRPSVVIRHPTIVTSIEQTEPVVTSVIQAPMVRRHSLPSSPSMAVPVLSSSYPAIPLHPGTPPPISPLHPLLPPVRFTFHKDWSEDYEPMNTAPTHSSLRPSSSEPPPPMPPPASVPQPSALNEAERYEAQAVMHEQRVEQLAAAVPPGGVPTAPVLQRQMKELLEAQEAMQEELRQVRVQVSSNYNDLETFRSEWQARAAAAAAEQYNSPYGPPPPQHHFFQDRAGFEEQREFGMPPGGGIYGGAAEERAALSGYPAEPPMGSGYGGGMPPDVGSPLMAAVSATPSGAGRSGDATKKPEVSKNLGYERNAELLSTFSTHLSTHVGKLGSAMPKKCCGH
mmetsp:Transcript_104148/g.261123  ORF Transcript_104148/g.261123 Transcript_104148/m.261123 type:complete len:514 (-) Transcript_104148:83-1624(-)